jgi:replicative DNA helicase
MNDADFDSVMIIAGERPDIRTIMSSTPTGRRAKFYEACTNPDLGFIEHFHPSMHNPNWGEQMEAEFRASLTASGYVHEVEAEFGVQDTGVFNKDDIDRARTFYNYAYNVLDYYQENDIKNGIKQQPDMYLYNTYNKAPFNRFRTVGVDFDKYQASSSIVVLEYNVQIGKFMVLKRYELPRAEYSYDAAVNAIIEVNEIYNPAWIYCDRGSGEYCIERLHIYGDEHPESGLKNKLKGWSFANKVEVYDPITGEKEAKPMKPFMVNQLQIVFERNNMVLSPWDDIIYKQLIDYEVEKTTASGVPVFTSKDEHYIDALGLAYLAMVLEFKKLTGVVQDFETASDVQMLSNVHLTGTNAFASQNARKQVPNEVKEFFENTDFSERRGERQSWVKLDSHQGAMNPTERYGSNNTSAGRSNWCSRGNTFGGGGFSRKGW